MASFLKVLSAMAFILEVVAASTKETTQDLTAGTAIIPTANEQEENNDAQTVSDSAAASTSEKSKIKQLNSDELEKISNMQKPILQQSKKQRPHRREFPVRLVIIIGILITCGVIVSSFSYDFYISPIESSSSLLAELTPLKEAVLEYEFRVETSENLLEHVESLIKEICSTIEPKDKEALLAHCTETARIMLEGLPQRREEAEILKTAGSELYERAIHYVLSAESILPDFKLAIDTLKAQIV